MCLSWNNIFYYYFTYPLRCLRVLQVEYHCLRWPTLPLHQRRHTLFMHNGAPPHFHRNARQHLNQTTFGEEWVGRGGPVNWPARSPDLNPLDFRLWGHLKTLVHSAPINELEVLQQRVENACQEIRVKPFGRVRASVRRRAESRVATYGNHAQHLL
jgi:hypothetical protein